MDAAGAEAVEMQAREVAHGGLAEVSCGDGAAEVDKSLDCEASRETAKTLAIEQELACVGSPLVGEGSECVAESGEGVGAYELAIALHPVSNEELMAVADAGLDDPEIVMPEKSTFFSPKILSGLFLYRHAAR